MKALPVQLSRTDRILVIDDNPDDLYLLIRAVRDAGILHPIDSCESVDLAVTRLAGMSRDGCLPVVIFCDLKMPGRNGFDFLEWRNTQPEFSALPVVITSGSALNSDVQRAVRLGSSAYFVKPLTAEDIKMVICEERDQGPSEIEPGRQLKPAGTFGLTPALPKH